MVNQITRNNSSKNSPIKTNTTIFQIRHTILHSAAVSRHRFHYSLDLKSNHTFIFLSAGQPTSKLIPQSEIVYAHNIPGEWNLALCSSGTIFDLILISHEISEPLNKFAIELLFSMKYCFKFDNNEG